MKKEGKPKFKKEQGEQVQPEEGPPASFAPPLPPAEEAAPPPASPEAKENGKGKPRNKKGNGQAPGEPCPEGMVPLEDGSCAAPQ